MRLGINRTSIVICGRDGGSCECPIGNEIIFGPRENKWGGGPDDKYALSRLIVKGDEL